MNVNEKLLKVQSELKAPKNLTNTFGKYKYRNCESILEAVKPILNTVKATIKLDDDVVEIGGCLFLKANATFIDCESNETIQVKALAQIDETHKGMSLDQITGTASSYARKYALNGLLLIDDTKDADSDEYKKENEAKKSQATKNTDPLATAKADINNYWNRGEEFQEVIRDMLKEYGKTSKTASLEELIEIVDQCKALEGDE